MTTPQGYVQVLEEEVDPKRCSAYGIDVVRRQTGGKAVLHDEELTYSLIMPEDQPALGQNAYENYRHVSEALIQALQYIQVPGELVQTSAPQDGTTGACFSSAARFEIVVHGRKLVGSAQRRARRCVLQHGSLLLGPGHNRLPMLLPHTQHARRQELMEELANRTTSVVDITGETISFEDMALLVKRGFEAQLGLKFQIGTLTAEEHAEATRLVNEKYGTDEWNARSKPRHIPR